MENSCIIYNNLHLHYDPDIQKVALTKCCQKRHPASLLKTWTIEEFFKIKDLYEELKNDLYIYPSTYDKSVIPYFCPDEVKKCDWTNQELEFHQIEISLASECNLHCRFCGVANLQKKIREQGKTKLLSEVSFKMINDLKKHNLVLRLTDVGEPFFYKDRMINSLLSLSEGDYKSIYFNTNGTLLNCEDIINLQSNSKIPVLFSISLNAWDSESYKKLMGQDYFDKVLQNIKTLKENNCDYTVTFVIDEIKSIPYLFSFLKRNRDIIPRHQFFINWDGYDEIAKTLNDNLCLLD